MQINLQLLQSIDNLIRLKATGNAYELAKRLEISRRTVFRYLEYLREDCQLVINYCKIRETYYYSSGAKHVIYLGLRK